MVGPCFSQYPRWTVADQDLIGMTVAEGWPSVFEEIVCERDLSLAALALASACADFFLPTVNDDPHGSAGACGR